MEKDSITPESKTPYRSTARLEYADTIGSSSDGVFTGLAEHLMPVLRFDHLHIQERRTKAVHRLVMSIRHAGKRIFHIRLIRKSGRFLVELSGVEPGKALDGIRVCREHFDRWFGITADEIEAFELKRRETASE